ncbi:MAG: cytochrome C [Desulfuromonadales bacterium]|nr:cytochrome C [Desulfuromonadales bacterium]
MKQIVTILATLLIASSALAAETTYREQIKPIFDSRCVSCHGEASPEYKAFKLDKQKWIAESAGPRMDSYAYLVYFTGWPDTGALMRRLDDAKPGNMYQHLGDTEQERQQNLALFKSWVGGWTLKRFKDLTKEELAAIKVAY